MRAFAAVAAVLISPSFAQEQHVTTPLDTAMYVLASCFNRSIANQALSYPADADLMSERAFLSCKTEEDMLRAQLNIFGENPATETTIALVKLRLKAKIRER
jgi:hypothetical protein